MTEHLHKNGGNGRETRPAARGADGKMSGSTTRTASSVIQRIKLVGTRGFSAFARGGILC